MIERRLGHEEIAEDVGPEGLLELRFIDVAQVLLGMLLGGVVDEDIEPAPARDGLRHGIPAEILLADIAGDEQRLAAFGLDEPPGFFGVLVLFLVDDRHLRTLAREKDGAGAADAAVPAG